MRLQTSGRSSRQSVARTQERRPSELYTLLRKDVDGGRQDGEVPRRPMAGRASEAGGLWLQRRAAAPNSAVPDGDLAPRGRNLRVEFSLVAPSPPILIAIAAGVRCVESVVSRCACRNHDARLRGRKTSQQAGNCRLTGLTCDGVYLCISFRIQNICVSVITKSAAIRSNRY
jgi:hypothetical protein